MLKDKTVIIFLSFRFRSFRVIYSDKNKCLFAPVYHQVMWVRRTVDKVSLLTVGNITYSGDPRIKVMFIYPNNWRLSVRTFRSKKNNS